LFTKQSAFFALFYIISQLKTNVNGFLKIGAIFLLLPLAFALKEFFINFLGSLKTKSLFF